MSRLGLVYADSTDSVILPRDNFWDTSATTGEVVTHPLSITVVFVTGKYFYSTIESAHIFKSGPKTKTVDDTDILLSTSDKKSGSSFFWQFLKVFAKTILSMEYRCLGLFLVFGLVHGVSHTADFYEYTHSLKRNLLQEQERQFAGWNTRLSEVKNYVDANLVRFRKPDPWKREEEFFIYAFYNTKWDEEIVNGYLAYLKWQEFQRTRDAFIPSRPVQDYLAKIQSSEVYKVLKKFPKGGSLHLHHDHVLSKSILLDMIINSSFYEHLYWKTGDPNKWQLDFFVNQPVGWAKVKDISAPEEYLLPHLIFTKVMDNQAKKNPTDSAIRWKEMEPLFWRTGSGLVGHYSIAAKQMEAMLLNALNENVQYLETKAQAERRLYVLDESATETHGKRFIDNDNGEAELQAVDSVVKDFITKHPEFIGFKRVIHGYRGANKEMIRNDLQKAANLYQMYPHLIAGYDLVAEEDHGYSLMFFQEDFNTLVAAHGKLPYFFHAGETNWPDDLLTSMHPEDPVSTSMNLYDAIILGAKRIGHGIALANHPYLMEVLKSKKIAVEANPVSNMMLGYVQDQRHHPAITYFRYGVPVVISADDPGTFGYDSFTIDWYEAFMGWGLDLADLRQLANNSLQYSAMSSNEKMIAFEKWSRAWKTFIRRMKEAACRLNLENTKPFISSIFPNEGYVFGGTKVQVFGRNFETSICKRVLCKFGDDTSDGRYVNNNLITCHSPVKTLDGTNLVPFSISFDNGETFHPTNLTFSFMHTMNEIDPSIIG